MNRIEAFLFRVTRVRDGPRSRYDEGLNIPDSSAVGMETR
jgi:hypothetical protein